MEEEEYKQSLKNQQRTLTKGESKTVNRQNKEKNEKKKKRENQNILNVFQQLQKGNFQCNHVYSPKVINFQSAFKLPKLTKYYSSRQDQKIVSPAHSLLCTARNKTKNQLDYGSKSLTLSEQINLKKVYLEKLDKILEEGNQLQKDNYGIRKKAKKLGRVIKSRYSKLYSNSKSIISGVESYLLDQQRNRKYKEQIRQLWMRSQK